MYDTMHTKVEAYVNQGWYNEHPSTRKLNCNGILTKKMKDFGIKHRVEFNSSSSELSIYFHSLVKMVDTAQTILLWNKLKPQELSRGTTD